MHASVCIYVVQSYCRPLFPPVTSHLVLEMLGVGPLLNLELADSTKWLTSRHQRSACHPSAGNAGVFFHA